MFSGIGTKDLLYMGGAALVNGLLCRAIPQNVPQLQAYNTGMVGYGLNIATGALGAWGIGKFVSRRAAQGAWIGMIVAVGQRIISDNFGAGAGAQSGGLSGDLDMDLGYYVEGSFPYPQGSSAGPYARLPGAPYMGQAAFPTTSASAVRAGQAAGTAALAPAAGMAAPGWSGGAGTAPGWA